VKNYIGRLRRKIEPDFHYPQYIITIMGEAIGSEIRANGKRTLVAGNQRNEAATGDLVPD